MTHLVLLTVFCLAQVAVGVAIGRRVRSTSDFFVAGRRLGQWMQRAHQALVISQRAAQ